MPYVVLFLFVITSLFANTSVTENDPSSIVEGVSIITGDFYTFEEDLVIQGREPIPFRRFYLSEDGHWQNFTRHFICTFLVQANCFQVAEPNGTVLLYAWTGQEKGLRRFDTRHFNANSQGISNTASAEISALTSLKNQYLLLEKDGKHLTLYAANGTQKRYRAMNGQKPDTLFGQKTFQAYYYMLESEEYPNGNRGNYFWDGSNHLTEIRTSNRSHSKIYAQVKIPTAPPSDQRMAFTGSDGSSLFVQKRDLDKKGKEHIQTVSSSWKPEQAFCFKKHHESGLHLLRSISLPQGRKLWIEYYDAARHRVKTLSLSMGLDDHPITTHSFFYDPKQRTTRVLDAYSNKTAYFWNEQDRLTQIERFQGETFHSADQFVWNGTNLLSKAFLDEHHQPVFARTFTYDERGNVLEETLRGNLSGQGSPLHLKDGVALEDGVERCTLKTAYNNRNLPIRQEDANGLVTLTEYRSDACLPRVKLLCDRNAIKIRQTYDYDQDLICIRETVDDGVCTLVKEITPMQEGSFIGLPQIIDEKAENILLKRTVLHYTTGAHVSKKDIYDAQGELRYSLQFQYDAKGRLLRETNPLDQEAISRYDEVGNRIYFKDFSGRLETYYCYDLANRLIEKKEIGCDGLSRIFRYAYDAKHNLISETDPYGNETRYTVDAFGNRIQTNLPAVTGTSSCTRHSYDSAGNEILTEDPEGYVTKTTYNAYGKPIQIIHPDNTEECFTYTLNGSLQTHKNTCDLITTYTYDYLGRVTKKVISSTNGLLAEENFEYTGYALTAFIDAEGHRTEYGYDKAGRKIRAESCDEITFYSYDALGRLHISQTGDLCTIQEYDLLGRLIEKRQESTSDEILRKERYEYDGDGNRRALIRSIAGKEERQEYLYDSYNRLISKQDALGEIETLSYNDAFLNAYRQKVLQKTHTDSMGLQTIEIYDSHQHLVSIEKKKEKMLALEEKTYDKRGLLVKQIDTVFAQGSSRKICTSWEYDSRGHLITLIEARESLDSKITRYQYTPDGRLTQTLKPDGILISYVYDELGRLVNITSSDGTVHHQMAYNRLGHLLKIDTLLRTVDVRGRVLSETFPLGYAVENHYDAMGRRSECRIPSADCLIDYAHIGSDLKKVERKTLSGKSLYAHRYLSHDLAGNSLEEELIGNLGYVRCSIDPLSRRTSLEAPHFSQVILAFDPAGNILRTRLQGEERSYSYDSLYQLTSESGLFAHDYIFDSLYNRLQQDSECYQINDLNQDLSHFTYDMNGNPIRQGNSHYSYDALGRLIGIESPDFRQVLTYDALHRCLSKTTVQNGMKTTRYFLYDGQNEIGSFDEQLNLCDLRILGHAPHAEIGASIAIELQGRIYAPIHDLHGNISVLLPVDQSEPAFYRYSAFGEEKATGVRCPWRFTSKRMDEQTGLVSFGRRFYLPAFGRWLTPDPAGFIDGMNLYAFVHNDPLTHFDEYGLVRFDYRTGWVNCPWNSQYSWTRSSTYSSPFGCSVPTYGQTNSRDARLTTVANPYKKFSPHFYVNGIWNTKLDNLKGAATLLSTFEGKANIIPFHSKSFGTWGDCLSVYKSKRNPNYTTDAIRKLNRELRADCLSMEALHDPRKVFITCFSRGSTDTYHAVKDFSSQLKDRLIVTACGPIMILPRELGFLVQNLVSKDDIWCYSCNQGLRSHPEQYTLFAEVRFLPRSNDHSRLSITQGHFFLSGSYQEGLTKYAVPPYTQHGQFR